MKTQTAAASARGDHAADRCRGARSARGLEARAESRGGNWAGFVNDPFLDVPCSQRMLEGCPKNVKRHLPLQMLGIPSQTRRSRARRSVEEGLCGESQTSAARPVGASFQLRQMRLRTSLCLCLLGCLRQFSAPLQRPADPLVRGVAAFAGRSLFRAERPRAAPAWPRGAR